jgi:hypothetical protein
MSDLPVFAIGAACGVLAAFTLLALGLNKWLKRFAKPAPDIGKREGGK